MTRPREPTDSWRDSVASDFAAAGDDTMPIDAHPDEDAWVRFACDELDVGERGPLVDHAFACGSCAATLRAVTHVRQGAAAIDEGAPPAWRAKSYPLYMWLGVAAALVIAVIGAMVLSPGEATRPDSDPVGSATPSTPSTPPAPAARAEPPSWARLETAPEVRLPASLALTVRGADRNREALEAFGVAIAHYRAGRFGEAANLLQPLAARRPDIPEFGFYLGIAQLFSGNSSAAVAPLRQARASRMLSEDAQWFEAVALEQAGSRTEARDLLTVLCASPHPYRARACTALSAGR